MDSLFSLGWFGPSGSSTPKSIKSPPRPAEVKTKKKTRPLPKTRETKPVRPPKEPRQRKPKKEYRLVDAAHVDLRQLVADPANTNVKEYVRVTDEVINLANIPMTHPGYVMASRIATHKSRVGHFQTVSGYGHQNHDGTLRIYPGLRDRIEKHVLGLHIWATGTTGSVEIGKRCMRELMTYVRKGIFPEYEYSRAIVDSLRSGWQVPVLDAKGRLTGTFTDTQPITLIAVEFIIRHPRWGIMTAVDLWGVPADGSMVIAFEVKCGGELQRKVQTEKIWVEEGGEFVEREIAKKCKVDVGLPLCGLTGAKCQAAFAAQVMRTQYGVPSVWGAVLIVGLGTDGRRDLGVRTELSWVDSSLMDIDVPQLLAGKGLKRLKA